MCHGNWASNRGLVCKVDADEGAVTATAPLGLESFGARLLSPSSSSLVSPACGRSVFSHAACRLVVGPEVVRGRGDSRAGGVYGGGPSLLR